MKLYQYVREVNKKLKQRKKNKAGEFLSPVRRIERVAPIKDGRYVAMTFDDGPMNLPPNPINENYENNHSLTALIIEIMAEYDAKGTFNIIGTTKDNYPDKAGKIHSTTWGGLKHDHYPKYGADEHGGAANQKELIRDLIENGHELSNHGYNHILFGRNRLVYGQRSYLENVSESYKDLNKLQEYLEENFNYSMKFSRPPHYIDKMPDGFNSYDLYAMMEYEYLAASYDGGGWMPTEGDYQIDIDKMVKPMERVLQESVDSLNGQIIFQKDGYNMSLITPVAHSLPEHLKLLKNEGYKVITVSDLLKLSPYEDIDTSAEYMNKLIFLDQSGYIIGYKNNTFQPERKLTKGEMLMMNMTKLEISEYYKKSINDKELRKNMKKNPYYSAYLKYDMANTISQSNEFVSSEDLKKFSYEKLNNDITIVNSNEILRKDYIQYIGIIK